MLPRHPFEWITIPAQKYVFVVLLVFTLALSAVLRVIDRPLQTAAAPGGIVSFELAGSQRTAQSILYSWGPQGQIYAGLDLGLDYLYMVAYAFAIGLGCVLVARNLSGRARFLASVGITLAWEIFGAALLDAVENYSLIQVLLGAGQEVWLMVARWCAMFKFLIVIVSLVYVAIGVVVIVVSKIRAVAQPAA